MLIFSDWNLTDDFLLTLKSQQEKTFIARFPFDLRTRKLLPKDLDMLQERNNTIKYTLQMDYKDNECTSVSLAQPVHKDDAESEEGDDNGEEIGCRYAVRHYLGLVSTTD